MQKCRQPLEPLLSVSVMRPGGARSDVPRDVPPGSRVLQVKKNSAWNRSSRTTHEGDLQAAAQTG
jgi:hypothetical protein